MQKDEKNGKEKMKNAVLRIDYPGDSQVRVHSGNAKEPHFIISGADIEDLDTVKISEYLNECDWCDRGSKGWITPVLRCDDFLK